MGRTLTLADDVEEIRLAPAKARGGLSRRLGRNRRGDSAATLRVTDSALTLRAKGRFEDGIEIPRRDVRKLVVDDGARWGYVSGVCRFPVYDLRPDGSGSGVLIGPLWSNAASLLPDGCPTAAVEPVPSEPPNVAILLDPPLAVRGAGRRSDPPEADWVAIVLLRAEDPQAAREALAAHGSLGDIAHDDLEYLTDAARRPGHPASGQQPFAASA
jgi:hypothetical protein